MAEYREAIPTSERAVKPGEEEIEISDSLTPYERIQKLKTINIARYRHLAVKEIVSLSRVSSANDIQQQLVPILKDMVMDEEPIVRQGVSQHIQDVAVAYSRHFEKHSPSLSSSPSPLSLSLSSFPSPSPVLAEFLVSLLQLGDKLLSDLDPLVRENACESFFTISQLIVTHFPFSPHPSSSSSSSSSSLSSPLSAESLLKENCVSVIHRFANSNGEVEDQYIGAVLLKKCAVLLGKALLIDLLPLLLSLSQNSSFRVRKEAAEGLAVFTDMLGSEYAQSHFLPIFLSLSTDKIWRVRKECIKAIVALSKALSRDGDTRSVISGVYESYTEDESRWVRTEAYQNIGPFIAAFSSADVSPSLLSLYTDMISSKNKAKVGDPFISEYCAFSFPGVLLTIGADRWPSVRECYHTLVKDSQWKVRRSLAASIHEVAKILGTDLTEEELVGCFMTFFGDLDVVRVGLLKNISDFLEVLKTETRITFLPTIKEIEEEQENWRYRKYLAKQLARLSTLIPSATLSYFVPCAFRLAYDPVASVRKHAVCQLGLMFSSLGDKEEEFVAKLLEKATSSSCYERQIFLDICFSMIDQVDVAFFTAKLLQPMLRLGSDPVPNVRLVIADIIVKKMEGNAKWVDQKRQWEAILARLKEDKDMDVKGHATADVNGHTA